MELFPASFYEYLFLFFLCFISFLIGWFLGRKRKHSSAKNEYPPRDTDTDITVAKKTIRAVQTRGRGGQAITEKTAAYTETDSEENQEEHPTEEIPLTQKDDLKQINGIGPVIEKKLNKMGIYTLMQISKFTREDIEKVATHLESFPKKIEKENWIQQAKALLKN